MEDAIQAYEDLVEGIRSEGFDIPDELLDNVAGGLGSNEAILLYRKMARAKKAGKSQQDLLDELKKPDTTDAKPITDEHMTEVETFIKRFW